MEGVSSVSGALQNRQDFLKSFKERARQNKMLFISTVT